MKMLPKCNWIAATFLSKNNGRWVQKNSLAVTIIVPPLEILFQIFLIRMTGDLNIMQKLADLEQRRFEVN